MILTHDHNLATASFLKKISAFYPMFHLLMKFTIGYIMKQSLITVVIGHIAPLCTIKTRFYKRANMKPIMASSAPVSCSFTKQLFYRYYLCSCIFIF
jgi:hypothetical protein